MRRAALLIALLLIAGCSRETTFDDRYNGAANEIEQRAARIDNQLNVAAATQPASSSSQR